MEGQQLIIVWTEPAKKDLREVYDFLEKISPSIAENQILRIINRVDFIEEGFTKTGQKEPLLSDFRHEYRYLVQDNYKIIYHQIKKEVSIDMVFDTRQNPEKLSSISNL